MQATHHTRKVHYFNSDIAKSTVCGRMPYANWASRELTVIPEHVTCNTCQSNMHRWPWRAISL